MNKTLHIILDHLAHSADAREIHREFPHLSLVEIQNAIAYYHDHQEEIETEIARRMQKADEFREKFKVTLGPSPLRTKL